MHRTVSSCVLRLAVALQWLSLVCSFHYRKNPLIRWIHQLVSSGGLILLSLNYQHKGTKTTVTLLAHMSHHHCWCWSAATLASSLSSSGTGWQMVYPSSAPSATWLHKNFTHATFILRYKRIYWFRTIIGAIWNQRFWILMHIVVWIWSRKRTFLIGSNQCYSHGS